MTISITKNVTIKGCGMPMMPMGGFCNPGIRMSIFPGYCSPAPMMGWGMMNNDMAAGYCIGTIAGNPGVQRALGAAFKAIGKACVWTFNNVLKPVGNFLWNNVAKPVWSGIKWGWDHTIGRIFKKKPKEAPKPSTTDATTKAE